MGKKPQKFNIGQNFISVHEQRIVLVRLAGERLHCYIEKVETLSEIIPDPELLRQRMKQVSKLKGIQWHYGMVPGNCVPSYQIKVFEPSGTDAVLGTPHRQALDDESLVTAAVLGTPHRIIPQVNDLPEPRPDLKNAIEELHRKIDNNTAKFKDFKCLKSGRDKFSNFKGEELAKLIPAGIKNVVLSELQDEAWNGLLVDKIYRWWLRGLSVEAAIRKVHVDEEISFNAIKSAYQKKFN